jgi:hypothetical protein
MIDRTKRVHTAAPFDDLKSWGGIPTRIDQAHAGLNHAGLNFVICLPARWRASVKRRQEAFLRFFQLAHPINLTEAVFRCNSLQLFDAQMAGLKGDAMGFNQSEQGEAGGFRAGASQASFNAAWLAAFSVPMVPGTVKRMDFRHFRAILTPQAKRFLTIR